MNNLEQQIADALTRRRWKVLRNGWPDFFAIREFTSTGEDPKIVAVEVKSGHDKLSAAQKDMHALLQRAGIPTMVVRSVKELSRLESTRKFLIPSDYQKIHQRLYQLEREAESLRYALNNSVVAFENSTDITGEQLQQREHDKWMALLEEKERERADAARTIEPGTV